MISAPACYGPGAVRFEILNNYLRRPRLSSVNVSPAAHRLPRAECASRAKRSLPYLDVYSRNFIAMSPFCVISSADASRRA